MIAWFSYIIFCKKQNSKAMLIIFIRAIIIFVTLIVVMRLMGKRQIGEMQPFEFIITLLIAELACVPMTDVSIPLLYGVVSIVAVFILHQALTILEQLSQEFKGVVDGKPAVVVNERGVDIKELKKNNMDVSDLIESLRGTGNFSLDAVKYAIYESNGKLSVLEKDGNKEEQGLPLLLVSEGKIDKKNYELIKMDENIMRNFMQNNGIKRLHEIEIMTVSGDGKVYLQRKNRKYEITKIQLSKEVKW